MLLAHFAALSGCPDSARGTRRGALRERLGHVFRDQIKQAVAVDVVFPEQRGVGDVGFLTTSIALRNSSRQPWLQMVDVADNHVKSLYVKQRFIFIFYTRS